MATLYDICDRSGLSTATVSRVINKSGLVAEKTRERVLQVMEELNYRPSHAARMLAGRKANTIGVVLPVIDNGYCVQVLRGIHEVSTKENLKMITSFYHSDLELAETLGSLCGEGLASGVILLNNTAFTPEKVRQLAGEGVPVVLLGQSHVSSAADIDTVLIDNFQGAYSAVERLLEDRPKSLLLLTGQEHNYDSQERLRGARKAIRDAPVEVEVTLLSSDYLHESGRQVFAEHIRRQGSLPDAIFAFNDAMALGVLDVLKDCSMQVPEDIQVIGFDNTEIAQYIGLSTVSVPMRKIGEEAGRMVAVRIRDKGQHPTSVTLDTRFVARKTTVSQDMEALINIGEVNV